MVDEEVSQDFDDVNAQRDCADEADNVLVYLQMYINL